VTLQQLKLENLRRIYGNLKLINGDEWHPGIDFEYFPDLFSQRLTSFWTLSLEIRSSFSTQL